MKSDCFVVLFVGKINTFEAENKTLIIWKQNVPPGAYVIGISSYEAVLSRFANSCELDKRTARD